MIKKLLILILLSLNSYACPPFIIPVPIANVSIDIDAKETKTSFVITWKFIKNRLLDHDKNQNQKFDKDEREEIQEEYIDYIKEHNFITEIVYVKKGQRVKKSLTSKINVKDSKVVFSGMDINYTFSFDTDFVLQKEHRLFIRILDPKQRVYIALKEIKIHNYNGIKSIVKQDIRANIYFYKHVKKYKSLKNKLLLETK